jgi:hypothetical protein
MSNLKLRKFRIIIETVKGEFGTGFTLTDGLNIVRAKNSRGKSACLNAILYVLGVEELLGGKNSNTMKPVLKSELKFEGETLDVLESKVLLEIENNFGEQITLTRWIKSNSRDERLIRVEYGAALTKPATYIIKDFYVHLPGSAMEDAGFHSFFVKFLKMELPTVPTFDGKERLLYFQTLFPLFFIEQTKGWGSFYSTPSLNFGIRDVAKRTLEFILDLDVMNNAKLKEQLKIKQMVILKSWTSLMNDISKTALEVNAVTLDLPKKVELNFDLNVGVLNEKNEVVSLEDKVFNLNKIIVSKKIKPVPIKIALPEIDGEIKKLDLQVIQLQNEINKVRRDLNLEKLNLDLLEENLQNLLEDLKKNKEAQRLLKLGSDLLPHLSNNQCPTCTQSVKDSLLAQDIDLMPMNLEENISYIQGQIQTVEYGISQSKVIINKKKSYLNELSIFLRDKRNNLRTLKQEVNEDPRMPSEYELEKVLDMKMQVRLLNENILRFEKYSEKIVELQNEWREYEAEQKRLPEEYFTNSDVNKIQSFERYFKRNLKSFDFSSVNLDEIDISLDKYTPLIEGVDVKFDTSASDYVRLIWAYTIALLQVSSEREGNHVGIMVFDEPGQHQMSIDSQKHLFEKLEEVDGQSIVASSLSVNDLVEITSGLKINIIDLGDERIIKPVNSL